VAAGAAAGVPALGGGGGGGGPTYPLAVLLATAAPFPSDVVVGSREDFLRPGDFEEAFGASCEAFFRMPRWKRVQLKKKAGLF
jgi:hypothetical protein